MAEASKAKAKAKARPSVRLCPSTHTSSYFCIFFKYSTDSTHILIRSPHLSAFEFVCPDARSFFVRQPAGHRKRTGS